MCKEPENHRSYQKKEPESRYVNTDRFYVRSKTEMQRWQNKLANEHIIHVMQNLKNRDIRLQKYSYIGSCISGRCVE